MKRLGLSVLVATFAAVPWVFRTALAQTAPPREDDDAVPDESPGLAAASVPELPPSAAPSGSGAPSDGMIHIPGGTFTMGSADLRSPPNERPRHVEVVAPFWIDRTEVTVQAYRSCVEARSCAVPSKSSASCTYDLPDATLRHLPVSCVHWRDADGFCRQAGKRLPREAEWEFAARGVRGGRFPWNNAAGGRGGGCFFASTLISDTTGRTCTKGPSSVGAHTYGLSPFGVMDMAGNVEEWTSDWYVENLSNGVPAVAGASHVLRGGGWLSAPSASRTTARSWGSSLEAGPNVGFRCAKDERP